MVISQQQEFNPSGVFSPHPPVKFPGHGFTSSASLPQPCSGQGRRSAEAQTSRRSPGQGRGGPAEMRRRARGLAARHPHPPGEPRPALPRRSRRSSAAAPVPTAAPECAKSLPGDAAGGGSSPALSHGRLPVPAGMEPLPARTRREDGPGPPERLGGARRGLTRTQRGAAASEMNRVPRATALPSPLNTAPETLVPREERCFVWCYSTS